MLKKYVTDLYNFKQRTEDLYHFHSGEEPMHILIVIQPKDYGVYGTYLKEKSI